MLFGRFPESHPAGAMDSSELYRVKQQFFLGAYKGLISLTLPPESSPDYIPTLVYQCRAHLALNNPSAALSLLPTDSEDVTIKAVSSLARYIAATTPSSSESSEGAEAALEELRDLSVEIEGDDLDASDKDKWLVRVLAGTAFARAGEVEEALETLGLSGGNEESVEAVALIVQIFLSISRPDLAKREYEKTKKWAEDDLPLQLIESTINLVTGKEGYSDSNSFYTEQLANPSLSSTKLLTARGVTRLLRGEVSEAKSDLEEAISQGGGDDETVAAYAVAATLRPSNKSEGDEWWSKLVQEFPNHPAVKDVSEKAELFDGAAAKFNIPSLPTVAV